MSAHLPQSSELSSWKQIANYLGVAVRTAQVWERERGLPVRRLPGPRGIVSASIAELESWRIGGQSNPVPVASDPTSWWWSRQKILLAMLVLVASIGLVAARFHPTAEPFNARVEEHALAVFDARGHELWQTAFGPALSPLSWRPNEQRVWIGDLDGDGTPEVLFGRRNAIPSGDDALICFSVSGRELWRFSPGRTVQTKAGTYPPPYSVRALAVTKLDGRTVIALSSSQNPNAPAQISLLTADGKILGEYWHFGHLPHLMFHEQSGRTLLYLGGIHNSDSTATVIVLDPMLLRGVRQGNNGPFLGIERLTETESVVFPRSRMNERFESYNGVEHFESVNGGLTVHVQERYGTGHGVTTLMYNLDYGLRLREIGPTDLFILDHKNLLPSAGSADEELVRLTNAYRTMQPSK